MLSRSQDESCFLPWGMRISGATFQSRSRIRLLISGSPGVTIGPNLVPFMTPWYEVRSRPLFSYPSPPGLWQAAQRQLSSGWISSAKLTGGCPAAQASLHGSGAAEPTTAKTESAAVARRARAIVDLITISLPASLSASLRHIAEFARGR